MSWYRTHRPRTVSQLHLTSAREALQGMMERGEIPHALLFAGPRGMGKTSSARIVAAVLNDPANRDIVRQHFFDEDLPDDAPDQLQEPDPAADIVQRIHSGSSYVMHEMDAASNRGIDDIRQLKERIQLPPQEGVISVYILDEVHMLTTEAFNALLKVLEEPPEHAVFVLATTEPHKIPETVRSRCTKISFHLASPAEIKKAVLDVLEKEKVDYEDAAIDQIVQLANGSFRDAIKLAEQLYQQAGAITSEAVSQHAPTGDAAIPQLTQAILDKNERAVVAIFQQLRSDGVPADYFGSQFLQFLHDQLMLALDVDTATSQTEADPIAPRAALLYLLKHLTEPASTHAAGIPYLELETACLDLVLKAQQQAQSAKQAT
jgi:DNA polymerase-3 subunit gamma/tau